VPSRRNQQYANFRPMEAIEVVEVAETGEALVVSSAAPSTNLGARSVEGNRSSAPIGTHLAPG
jgi:hypothetical protein